jgi:hypothetical protein
VCYKVTFILSNGTHNTTVSGSGMATITAGSGAYADGSTVYVKVEKTCSTVVREDVTYSIQFHL